MKWGQKKQFTELSSQLTVDIRERFKEWAGQCLYSCGYKFAEDHIQESEKLFRVENLEKSCNKSSGVHNSTR